MTQYARYPGKSPVTLYDASGNPISSTGGSLDVNVTGGSIIFDDSFSNGSPVPISVSNSSSIIAASNVSRKFLRISNFSSESVWLQYGAAAAVSRGVRLTTNSFFEITSIELYTGDVHAISGGATVDVDVFEGFI